jgi:hypothetical protein
MILRVFLTDPAEPYLVADAPDSQAPGRTLKPTPIRGDGFVDAQLAVSRDTVSWKRYREPFIPRGEPGAWDWGMIFADAPVLHDGKLCLHYSGSNLTHGGRSPRLLEAPFSTERRTGRGLAVLRPDGYVSVDATSFAPGILTTHRFRQESGGTVRVNVDASAGQLRYELLEDIGASIPGFTLDDCDPIRLDTLDQALSWKGVPGWPGVSAERSARFPSLGKGGVYVQLRFYVYPGTKLYSVTLDPPEVTMWRAKVTGGVD